MGTSKGYIAPTKTEWTESKRAVTSYLRNKDIEARTKALGRFAQAMRTGAHNSNARFATVASDIMRFASVVSKHGVTNALESFGLTDLIGKSSDEIMDALLDHFMNNESGINDSVLCDALTIAFRNLGIESLEDFGKIDIVILLRELLIEYIDACFDLRFEEKIGKGRSQEEKFSILKEIHIHISNTICEMLNEKELTKINFDRLDSSKIVAQTLDDTYQTFISIYDED